MTLCRLISPTAYPFVCYQRENALLNFSRGSSSRGYHGRELYTYYTLPCYDVCDVPARCTWRMRDTVCARETLVARRTAVRANACLSRPQSRADNGSAGSGLPRAAGYRAATWTGYYNTRTDTRTYARYHLAWNYSNPRCVNTRRTRL